MGDGSLIAELLVPFSYNYMLKAMFAGQRVHFVERTLCEYRVHTGNTIDEDMEMLLFEEAWIIAKFLPAGFGRIDGPSRLAVAQRICDKGLGGRVMHILRAAEAGSFDDEPIRARLQRDFRERGDDLSQVVDARQIVEEMGLIEF